MPVWLLITIASVLLFVLGGIVWAREWGLTDPRLEEHARELVPAGATTLGGHAGDCDATNGWDRWYRPQKTCYGVGFSVEPDRRDQLGDLLNATASDNGWNVRMERENGLDLERAGYTAIVRYLSESQAEQCRATAQRLGEAGDGCFGSILVIAD